MCKRLDCQQKTVSADCQKAKTGRPWSEPVTQMLWLWGRNLLRKIRGKLWYVVLLGQTARNRLPGDRVCPPWEFLCPVKTMLCKNNKEMTRPRERVGSWDFWRGGKKSPVCKSISVHSKLVCYTEALCQILKPYQCRTVIPGYASVLSGAEKCDLGLILNCSERQTVLWRNRELQS